jgi:hypothetical protein
MDKRHAFYNSSPWRDLAYRLKVERGGKCARCGETVIDFSLLIGHHYPVELTEENVDDASISLNPDNIEIVCHRCHNKEHRRDWHHTKQVYIIWGSPLSGKGTLLRQLVKPGDLVMDIDAIWQAVTLQPLYVKPNRVRFNVFPIRDLLLDHIKTRYGQWYDAYVVGGYPDRYEREQMAAKLGAELIYCDATREQCLERAAARPPEWIEYVHEWWRIYERTG